MLQQHKKQHKNGGFTLVELIVVLAITAILAALVGGGLMAYARMARFEKNEANARTLFQAAQISLTRMDTAGELDAFCDSVGATDNVGGHFTTDVTIKDADGNDVRTRTAAELNQSIYALYYDKTGATADNQNALVEQLLSDYIYDESLLNAAICVEIDRESGQVYSVFYDTSADKLRFGDVDGAVNIMDRSYTHRRNDSLVGYYSSEDRVNVVELQQTQLKVKNPRLSNGETLTLSWGSNSRLNDFDTVYTATAYASDDTEKTKPLFQITIERDGDNNTTGSDDKQVIKSLKTVIYDEDGNPTTDEPLDICYPLSYSKGNFVLTLDAMMDAYQLRTSENAEPEESAYQDLYSITRLLNQPQDFYIVISAEPQDKFADSYTASKDETTNVENTLLASGSTADKGELQYFRHLYNLRWADDWTHTDTAATTKYTYTLIPQANNSNGLNWTGGSVTVYCTVGNREHPEAKTPTLSDPVAWPTIRQLSQKTVLTCETTNIANEPKVPILNLQINNKSVAKEGIGNKDELRDHYAGLVGLSLGEISNITLRDVDMQVNVTVADDTTVVGDDSLLLLDGTVLTAVKQDDADYRDIRAAGALCGASNGTIENCTLERGTNTNTSATVRAAIYFDDTTIVTDPVFNTTEANGKTYRYIENELHGIGGLVGVAMPAATAKLDKLTVSADVSVAGLLVDASAGTITEAYLTPEKAEETRYDQAAIDPNDKTEGQNTLWRAVGVGGVIGSLDATNLPIEQGNFVNGASVVGSGFTGGIVGNLYSTRTDTKQDGSPLYVILNDLKNTGTVCAGASYKGDRTGEAHSRVLGQFFGGIVGYSRNVELLECTSKTRGDLTETQLKNQVAAGYDSDGSLTDASPLRGDFVGGLVGFGKNIELDNCTTEKGFVLGNRFVGGLVGGFTGSTMDTGSTNTSYVFGNRYVGGIVSVNGSGSQISNMVNTGLVAGLGKNAAYVGGIVGRNDAEWGAKGATNTKATIINGVNRMASDSTTNNENVALLQVLSQHGTLTEYAKSVGGIVGYNGVNGVVTWNDADCTDLGAILYGDSFVGGIAGYNDEKATISNTSGKTLTISGQIVAAGDAIGGMIGMNCAPKIPAVEVKATSVEGEHFVGGVIGANLPVGSFAVVGGTLQTSGSGSVIADGVAGGIIGYNRLLSKMPVVSVTHKEMLPTIDNDGLLTAGEGESGTETVTLAGFKNELNIYANAYVGGIVGYNDSGTTLKIQGAINGNSSNQLSVGGVRSGSADNNNLRAGVLTGGVDLNKLANGHFAFGDNERGAIAGGIIGYASAKTTVADCTNYGNVAHRVAAGGLVGWNDGTITGGGLSATTTIGSRESGYRYLGGAAGVNVGNIENVAVSGSVNGDEFIGGLAGANIGGGTIACGTTGAKVAANSYAGGAAGINIDQVSVGSFTANVTATSYAGGLVGKNTRLGDYVGTVAGNGTNPGTVTGSVSATNYVGGAAGWNDATITNIANNATVRADNQYAGGIAGVNEANGSITSCQHTGGAVYATSGEVGGIAGRNAANARIDTVTVSANVTANSGAAGGITASNYGTIGTEARLGGNVQNCTITGTGESIGAVVAYNQAGGTITNVTLAENANIKLNTSAVNIGGLAGRNVGTVTKCEVKNGALDLAGSTLKAGSNTVTLGGAVGVNTGAVSGVTVTLDITQNLEEYTNMGGVAGRNGGTLVQCAYSGTIGGRPNENGNIVDGAASVGSTAGGIVGVNTGKVESCTVSQITLQVQGASSLSETQSAEDKLKNASHTGGIAGRNDGTISTCYIAADKGNMVAARNGFVGGVAGSNSGTITGSGSKAVFTESGTTPALMTQVNAWLSQTMDDNTTPVTTEEKNKRLNDMRDTLLGDTYAKLKGVDTVSNYTGIEKPDGQQGSYAQVYTDTGLNRNDLLVVLRGSNNSETDRANGYLGGIAGFNTVTGVVKQSATGKWFVYADNATTSSAVGGIIGQNESDVTTENTIDSVVNCAAVRRFSRVVLNGNKYDDTDNENIFHPITKQSDRVIAYVGGVIGTQQNRINDRWTINGCINYGTVFDSRSSYVGGIVAYWRDNGGTIQNCFNFGDLFTNTNDNSQDRALSGYGAVGGIAGLFDKPVSNGTTNILSCRNYGSIRAASDKAESYANDCAGILGEIEMREAKDYMTLNIIDCVNAGAIKANSQAVGILAWIGPWSAGSIDNVQVNIDRCRNLNVNFEAKYRNVGIVGSRGNGAPATNATTKVTNCFALTGPVGKNYAWKAGIAYDLDNNHNESIEGSNNYYIDGDVATDTWANRWGFGNAKLRYLRPDTKNLKPNKDDWTKDTVQNDTAEVLGDKHAGAHRLFVGGDVESSGNYKYFAFLPTLNADKDNVAYDIKMVWEDNSYLTLESGSWSDFDATIYIRDQENTLRGEVYLRFNETGKDSRLDWTDITDEDIQKFYTTKLYKYAPNAPGTPTVKRSIQQDAANENNVYGRYEVTWTASQQDATHGPAMSYRVEILQGDTVLRAVNVYDTRYTFDNTDNWKGDFTVRVTPYNTAGDGESVTSDTEKFVQALPTPEIEIRMARDTETPSFPFSQYVVLKNADKYPDGTTVTVNYDGLKNPVYLTKDNATVRLEDGFGKTVTLTAVANPADTNGEWMRSAQYKQKTYIPKCYNSWENTAMGGLVPGALQTSKVEFNGQNVENLSATATLNFAPESTESPDSPIYRVLLRAKYTGNDTVTLNGTEISLNGYYITLAAKEQPVQNSDTQITLTDLPVDTLTNYEDWQVIAVPATSGLGDVVTRWTATEAEAAAAIEKYGSDAWYNQGLEIVRTGKGTYSYMITTPLCLADPEHYLILPWAYRTENRIMFKRLTDSKTVLPAPTLAARPESTTINGDNQLVYTFRWTQSNLAATANTPEYEIKLYGLIFDENGNETGQELLTLENGVTLHAERVPNTSDFTLTLNVDSDLKGGSASWHYSKIRLEVIRKTTDKGEIGAAATVDYDVMQRLPAITAPNAITRVDSQRDNADALLYTVSWTPSTNEYVDHYDLCAVDANGNLLQTWSTASKTEAAAAPNSLQIDLEQYQGEKLCFYVVARTSDANKCYDGPNGSLSESETIVTRATAPTATAADFADGTPSQSVFLNNLQLNMALAEAPGGDNIRFTGYLFDNAADYEDVKTLAASWQSITVSADAAAAQNTTIAERRKAKADAQAALTAKLEQLIAAGTARRVIPNGTVGAIATVTGANASYTFTPNADAFTMTPDNARQYLLPAVRLMPTDGSTPSNWYYFLDGMRLPAIKLDTPQTKLTSRAVTQTAKLYDNPQNGTFMGTEDIQLQRFAVEWSAVNAYTADGKTRSLTDRYEFTVQPMATTGDQAYTIELQVYDRQTTDEDGTEHARGEIKTVTKTLGEYTYEIPKTEEKDGDNVTRTWYDLSLEPTRDAETNEILKNDDDTPKELVSKAKRVTGKIITADNKLLYYAVDAVPELEVVQADGAEPTYLITLPDLQSAVTADEQGVQTFTNSITVTALMHSDDAAKAEEDAKTANSEEAIVTVNQEPANQDLPESETPVAVEAAEPTQPTEPAAVQPEPTAEPAAEQPGAATAQPTAEPTPAATATPAPAETAESTPEPDTPAGDTDATPTPEPIAEPTPEPAATAEPTEAPSAETPAA